ncbi:MAG: hypothetical protein ACLUEQ_06690 [Cloacibacillus evryensis]
MPAVRRRAARRDILGARTAGPAQPREQRGRATGRTLKDSHGGSAAIDLTAMAKGRELDPVIGRVKEIQRVVQILSRRTKNNPVLIGSRASEDRRRRGLAQRISRRYSRISA